MTEIETKRYRLPPNGVTWVHARVVGIDGDIAQVQLGTGQVEQVSLRLLPGKSHRPKPNERWLLDQRHGLGWTFAIYLGTDEVSAAPQWTLPTLQGTWMHYSTPGTWTPGSGLYAPVSYLLDVDGVVRLRGTAAGPGVSASDLAGPLAADIFQLPSFARPSTDGLLLFGTASGQVKVYPDGWVRAVTGTAAKVSLDGVWFLAG